MTVDTDEANAWWLWCERGVVIPEYAGEIADRRRLCREWERIGRPLL